MTQNTFPDGGTSCQASERHQLNRAAASLPGSGVNRRSANQSSRDEATEHLGCESTRAPTLEWQRVNNNSTYQALS
eukprot:1151097-Pelagomonas_calceolata.AAC.5